MTEFDVEAVPDEQKEDAIAELRRTIEPTSVAEAVELVVIASDFGAAVRDHLPETEGERYDPIHQYGAAVGKTIPRIVDDQLRFVIVFDRAIFADMSPKALLDRQYWVVHELSHVKNALLRFRHTQRDPYVQPRNKEEYLFESASGLWEEYCAERTAADSVLELVRTVSDTAELGFSLTDSHAKDVLKRLQEFGPFLRESIPRFRVYEMDINEFVAEVSSRIRNILLILAYVYALRGVSKGIDEKVSEIDHDESFKDFFAESWKEIVQLFDELYEDRDTYRPDLLERIGEAFDDILQACGMKMSDSEGGYYVEVLDV